MSNTTCRHGVMTGPNIDGEECRDCVVAASTKQDAARRIVRAFRAHLITRDEMTIELAALLGLDIRCLMGECIHIPEVSR